MVRAPCCEKMGLKKGPWNPEEDHILISYIQKNGHGNWRALPKQAGLLRCGKSCRLRWTNYLRPDIKRGNFSNEEEATIIKLHELLGNRWSAIAARLPGRTDNEIKNVWHTHLKKRLKNNQTSQDTKRHYFAIKPKIDPRASISAEPTNSNFCARPDAPVSPQQSSASTDLSSVTDLSTVTRVTNDMIIKQEQVDSFDYFPHFYENFGSKELSGDNSNLSGVTEDLQFQFESQSGNVTDRLEQLDAFSPSIDGNMDFWYNLFIRAGELLPELPEF